jgi:hypothetical protein
MVEPAEEEENQKGRVRGCVWLRKGEWPVLLLWGRRVSGCVVVCCEGGEALWGAGLWPTVTG